MKYWFDLNNLIYEKLKKKGVQDVFILTLLLENF